MSSQMSPIPRFPYAHTFSIVARDPESGCMGVAVQSHWFSVGTVVTWAEAGVGVVATQAMAEVSYGPLGLSLMRAGKSAPVTLKALLSGDEGKDLRQVAMIDIHGQVAVHTGTRCMADAGHLTGEGFSVQANMMSSPEVWPAMAYAYQNTRADFADRLIAALEAGQAAGGDIRGQQSAAILIVNAVSTGRAWADTLMELRVEDHPHPVFELKRLVQVHRAYQLMNQGDEHLGKGDIPLALQSYSQAASLAPDYDEIPFWHAVTLTDLGQVEEALPIFKRVFAINPNWARLLQRLPPVGLLNASPEVIQRILNLVEK
jgi:uncharacterized Ntn-hydrolase superfamily protein